MIVVEKELWLHNKNDNPVAKIIVSTELPIPEQYEPEKYKILKLKIIFHKQTYIEFIYIDDIRKALKIFLEKPYDDTLTIRVPCYNIDIKYNYVSIESKGALIFEYINIRQDRELHELQMTLIEVEPNAKDLKTNIKFFINEPTDLYKTIQLVEKVWETPNSETGKIK